MRITEEEARRAGELTHSVSWTDEELTSMIRATKLVIAYLEGRGMEWQLALTPLRHDLYSFEGFAYARKQR